MAEEHYWTWEDIVHLPEQEMPEIIDGKRFFRAPTRGSHAAAMVEIGCALAPVRRRDVNGWWILADLDVRLSPQRTVRPDLCGYRKDRLPELPDDWPLNLRPDWVCEILSPSNSHYDRATKGMVYAQAEIPWYWLVDPVERLVEVRRLQAGEWVVHGCYGDEDRVAMPPFDDLQIEISELFLPKSTGS